MFRPSLKSAPLVPCLFFFAACSATLDPATDLCPDDAAKVEPGACGCGVADTDANRNGVPDCFDNAVDLCPDDASKTQGGACGCGVSDADANSNGVPDCLDAAIDLCPTDATKTQSGVCGCGVSDADANANGVPDCLDSGIDLCPDDADKTQAGVCGCAVSDADANANGVPDCLDANIDFCPDDEDKTLPGICGCGASDVDADSSGIPDCLDPNIDLCAEDDNKTLPGVCGCGVADTDADHDRVPDCIVPCPAGFRDCDGNPENGCEAQLAVDSKNCGACGTVCDGGWTCESSECVINGAMLAIAMDAPSVSSLEVTLQIMPSGNMVVNPYADDGLNGYWVAASGNGWANWGGGLFSPNTWSGSYNYESFGQTIDLSSSATALDAGAPITVGGWAESTSWAADRVVVAVAFLDASGAQLDARTLFDGSGAGAWQFEGATISDYPAGTRGLNLSFGEDDGEYWADYYGARFDGATAFVGDREMRFSNDGETWSEWAAYSPTAPWVLAGTGTQRVYVQVRDTATSTVVTAHDDISVIPD